jgi:hypothetical protein
MRPSAASVPSAGARQAERWTFGSAKKRKKERTAVPVGRGTARARNSLQARALRTSGLSIITSVATPCGRPSATRALLTHMHTHWQHAHMRANHTAPRLQVVPVHASARRISRAPLNPHRRSAQRAWHFRLSGPNPRRPCCGLPQASYLRGMLCGIQRRGWGQHSGIQRGRGRAKSSEPDYKRRRWLIKADGPHRSWNRHLPWPRPAASPPPIGNYQVWCSAEGDLGL